VLKEEDENNLRFERKIIREIISANKSRRPVEN
jgi:hypothetical protein